MQLTAHRTVRLTAPAILALATIVAPAPAMGPPTMEDAQALHEAGRWEEAAAAWRYLVEEEPDHVPVRAPAEQERVQGRVDRSDQDLGVALRREASHTGGVLLCRDAHLRKVLVEHLEDQLLRLGVGFGQGLLGGGRLVGLGNVRHTSLEIAGKACGPSYARLEKPHEVSVRGGLRHGRGQGAMPLGSHKLVTPGTQR